MSICLAMVAASALSSAVPSATMAPVAASAIAAPSASVPAGPRAVQYVQVQYRNVLKNSLNHPQQVAGSALKAQAGSFLRSILQTALSHLNPVLGIVANMVANKVASKLTNPPVNMHPKPDVKIVAEFEATTTIAPARTRTDLGNISTIVQCDKQQIIVLDNASKTYSTQSFDASIQDADAESGSSFGPFGGGAPDLTQQTIVPQPDDGLQTIAGLVARHELFSAPMTTGFGSAKTDLWFADMPMRNACTATPRQAALANVPIDAEAASTVRIPLRSVQWSAMDFSRPQVTPTPSPDANPSPVPSASPDKAAASSYQDPILQTPGIAWVETTSVKQLPYDPSYFGVPAGFTLAQPEPSPSPM